MIFNDPPLGTEPCPEWASTFLRSRYPDGGTSTWLVERVGQWITEAYPDAVEQLLGGVSEFGVAGPDDEGQLRVTAWAKEWGTLLTEFDLHWLVLISKVDLPGDR